MKVLGAIEVLGFCRWKIYLQGIKMWLMMNKWKLLLELYLQVKVSDEYAFLV
jgi:hypothetical protein